MDPFTQHAPPPPTTKYLRVRRRRNAGTALTLRVEGLCWVDDCPNDEEKVLLDTAPNPTTTPRETKKKRGRCPLRGSSASMTTTTTTAIWRKVEDMDIIMREMSGSGSDGTPGGGIPIMEAILSEDDDDEVNVEESHETHILPPAAKRRRLTFVIPSSSTTTTQGGHKESTSNLPQGKSNKGRRQRCNKPLRILSPVERLVDDSLQAVAIGDKTVQQHIQFLGTEQERLQTTAAAKGGISSSSLWSWTWCNPTIGTILHVAALWNDVKTTARVVSFLSSTLSTENLLTFLQVVDGQGLTAYDVAQELQHTGIMEILQSYGGGAATTTDNNNQNKEEKENDDNYVYDVYCWDGQMTTTHDNTMEEYGGDDHNDVDTIRDAMACIVQNGYWNTTTGELVVYPDTTNNGGDDHVNANNDNEDEEDSNAESWQGNDYPEEEDDDDEEDMINDDIECMDDPYTSSYHHDQYRDDGDYDYAYGM
jgi:hypothetical protein